MTWPDEGQWQPWHTETIHLFAVPLFLKIFASSSLGEGLVMSSSDIKIQTSTSAASQKALQCLFLGDQEGDSASESASDSGQ